MALTNIRRLLPCATLFCSILPASANSIPMQLDQEQWQVLEYRSITANRISEVDQGLHIEVKASASPLIYVFSEPQLIHSIRVHGEMGELPGLPPGITQGDKGADDFPLRIGLVIEGEKRLNFAQRLIAADWIKILFSLAPKETGIDHVYFLNLANPGYMGWQQRTHPSSKGLYAETVVKEVEPHRPFLLDYTLAKPQRVLALWISADGDDTDSEFSLTLNSINYNETE